MVKQISIMVLLVLAGCARMPMQFPIGLYDVPPQKFREVSEAGFNVVVSEASATALKEAQTYNLKILASTSSVSGSSERERRASLRKSDRHSALWAWYLVDEPDLHLVSPSKVTAENA